MAVVVQANTPLAEQLSNIVQPKLVDIGWTTGASDDSALAEYIILMLVNGKTQEQIAAELSNDLLNLGPEDSGAIDFARWLFEQVSLLSGHSIGVDSQAAPVTHAPPTQAIPTFFGGEADPSSRAGSQNIDNGMQDADMSDSMDGVQAANIPTGPKSMRNGNAPRNNGRRLVGQLNKAMDRSNDHILHRVKAQGADRVGMHNRQPPKGPTPKGPRGNFAPARPLNNGIPTGPAKNRMMNQTHAAANPQFSAQQQAQLFNLLTQMMGSGGSPGVMPGMPTPVINPHFRVSQNQPQGKSLFDRVEGRPQKSNSHFSHSRPYSNASHVPHRPKTQDTEMNDATKSMEVESSHHQTGTTMTSSTNEHTSPEEVPCKFNLKCTKVDCPFAHQSPAAPPGTTIDPTDPCPFAAACQNRKCTARHPSPAQKKTHQAEQDCKFFPNCTNAHCPFRHPTMPMCRNGADCTREGCKFTHVQTACKFNPCLNPSCVFKHEAGQKRGTFGDKVWKAGEDRNGADEQAGRAHVSERKFVDDDGEEELIIAGGTTEVDVAE